MLSETDILNRAAYLLAGTASVDDFEDWFREESRDVHLWGGESLIAAVFAVESVLSEYHFADLGEHRFAEEMVNAIVPFVPHRAFRAYAFPGEKWEGSSKQTGNFPFSWRTSERSLWALGGKLLEAA